MSNYVKIVAKGGVRVSLDGINTTLLEEGQIYDVPMHVKQALIESKRGKEPTKRELKKLLEDMIEQAAAGAADDDDAQDGDVNEQPQDAAHDGADGGDAAGDAGGADVEGKA